MPRSNRRQFLLRHLALLGFACAPPVLAGSAPPVSAFLAAVIAGRLEEIRQRLDADPGLLAVRDADGRSAFALALLHHHREVGELLRQRGHQPDLHESALAGDWERFETLAEASPETLDDDHPIGGSAMKAAALGGTGADLWRIYNWGGEPNVRPGGIGQTSPLRAAFEFPDLAVAEMTAATLLSNGADPNLGEPGGDSTLHAAARRGSLELVEMLIRHGARLDAVNAWGRRPADLATEYGHPEVSRLLGRAALIPRRHQGSRLAWDVAGRPYRAPDLSDLPQRLRGRTVGVAHFDFEALRALVEKEPRLVHARQTTTEGAVEACAHTGQRPIVDYLLERGAPYSLPTAVMRNDAKRVGELLERDPRLVHERGAHDFPLLWYPVIGGGHLELAERLLTAGAEVEDQHWMGTTALHWAARTGQEDLAALFLEHGGDPRRPGRKFDPRGQSPIEIARERGHDGLAEMLTAHAGRVRRG